MSGTSGFGRLLVLIMPIILAGCGGEPMPFPTPESELGTRPGLLTGESGTWEIHPLQKPPPQPR